MNTLDSTTLRFVAHWLTKKEKDSFDYLGAMLGTNWNRQRIRALFSDGSGPQPDEFLVPLSYLIAPNLKEMLKPSITTGDGEILDLEGKIKPLTDMPKEEFLERYKQNRW